MPAEAAANVMNIIFFFSILFIWLLICAGFSCTGENRPGNACTGKAVLGQKSLKDGEFGAVYGWAGIGTDAARARPKRAFLAATGAVCGNVAGWVCIQLLARG